LEDFEARGGLANPQLFSGVTTFLPEFERIVQDMIGGRDSYIPIVMATRPLEQTYLDFDPRLRLLKRAMALEALFSSDTTCGKKATCPSRPEIRRWLHANLYGTNAHPARSRRRSGTCSRAQ
jgi:hypothetical protein